MANATNVKIIRRVDREGNLEPFELMMKRFKKAYQESGVLQDLKNHEFAMGPSEKRRIKRENAEKRRRREEAKARKFFKSDDKNNDWSK